MIAISDDIHALQAKSIELRRAGRLEEAAITITKAIELVPGQPALHFNRAVVFLDLGWFVEAEADLAAVLALGADVAEAHFALGRAQDALGRKEAIASFAAALARKPEWYEAAVALGEAALRHRDFAKAQAGFEAAARSRPDEALPIVNLAMVHSRAGDRTKAREVLEHAATTRPDEAEIWIRLADLRIAAGDPGAVAAAERGVALRPRDAGAWLILGRAAQAAGEMDPADAAYAKAMELDPTHGEAATTIAHFRLNRCDWRDGGAAARALVALSQTRPIWPWAVVTVPSSALEQRRAAEIWCAANLPPAPPPPPWRRREGERLRLGYLSNDFHQHATAYLIAELFERHDRAAFEVIGYSHGPDDGGPLRRRMAAAFDRFVDVTGLDDTEAAARIAADGVDILIDLKGYTQGARPGIAAARPAPLQVAYLGYPGTSGMAAIDYVLVDRVIAPVGAEAEFSEKLVRLPDSYQVNDTRRAIADWRPTRAELGLPESGFVFCCFNNLYKLTPEIFAVWMRLLRGVEGSVIWLYSTTADQETHLRRSAAAMGVDPGRLVFAPAEVNERHLARARLADLFLDTTPVNAHTTAADVQYVGLPVLTVLGEAMAGRVGASLLRAVGLPELVATSLSEYETLALDLARNPGRLGALRRRLVDQGPKSALFDIARFTRHIEAAYHRMAAMARNGAAPDSFEVEAISR
ncbi:MAG: hypothetical protein FJX47_07240 [Alphaproteobacteria bacterium]|nr:hypothetical protein [Alphaproteobacteria bacterium]